MKKVRTAFVAAAMVCLAQTGGAQTAGASPQPLVSSKSLAPSSAGVLATVRIEFREPDRAVISIAPGLYDSSQPADREEAVATWRTGDGRLLLTYDGTTDRLQAVVENGASSTAVVYAGALTRGFGKLDPLRFAPSVMGFVAETANRGAVGSIELRDAEVGLGRSPRRLQDIGAGPRAVSQLLHAQRAMARGFSLTGTIRFTEARPSETSPLTIEVRLLADQATAFAKASPPHAPKSSDGTFTNTTPTTFGPLGTANPYPSQITIAPNQLTGVLTSVVVGLDNLDHTYPREIGALVVAPSGRNVELMRKACGDFDLLDVDLTFDETAPLQMPASAPCFTGRWKTTRNGFSVLYPPPAPQPPSAPYYGQTLSVFVGDSPIGTWSLFIDIHGDFELPDFGRIDGWSLTLTTAIPIPGSGTFGTAAPYPSTYTVSGFPPSLGLSTCTVLIEDLTHTYLGDVHLLFVVPSGQTAYLVGNACSNTNAVNLDWTFNDYAAVGFLPASSCVSGTYRPTIVGVQGAFPAPAPAGPYGRSLAAVSGSGVNGVFALYALDDATGDVGSIRDWSFFCAAPDSFISGDGFETGDFLRWTLP